MNTKRILLAAGLLVAVGLAASQAQGNLPGYFYKHLEGTIGGTLKIVMDLTRAGAYTGGDYHYVSTGAPLSFTASSSISDDGTVVLEETTGAYDNNGSLVVSGTFRGRFTDPGSLTGTWTSADGKKSMPFTLTESRTPGSASVAVQHQGREYTSPGDWSASIELTYPEVMPDAEVQRSAAEGMNRAIVTMLAQAYQDAGGRPTAGIDAVMADFVERFKQEQTSRPSDAPHLWWYDTFSTRIMLNENGLLALETQVESFEGGAHPSSSSIEANFMLADGRRISFGDLFAPGARTRLSALAEPVLRKLYNLSPGSKLSDAGFYDDQLVLNDNFLLTAGGILFSFNPGEIAPRVLGAPLVFLPYSRIRNLLKPGSPVEAFLH